MEVMKTRVFILFVMLFAYKGLLKGQDLYLTFSGYGASISVDSVWVENLTSGEKLILTGSQVLHLAQMVTGTKKVNADVKSGITFSPNPINEYSIMEFSVPVTGKTAISIIDLSGKEVLKISGSLSRGGHLYRISGLKTGMHFVRITSGRYSLTGTLISISSGEDVRAEYISTASVREPEKDIAASEKQEPEKKGPEGTVFMEYSAGQNLKFMGIAGNYSTVMVDKPAQSKIITFEFIPCADGDNNNYPVVKIGGEIWMAENMKATKFNDGTPIQNVTDNETWKQVGPYHVPAYCWYNNEVKYKDIYGALYNEGAVVKVSGKNVCPVGWHVASGEWWHMLSLLDPNTTEGDSDIAGIKLKESGSSHWNCSDNSSTNETGFSALPGGFRYVNVPAFKDIGSGCIFWDGSNGKFSMNCNYGGVSFTEGWDDYGLSVRCVKDNQ